MLQVRFAEVNRKALTELGVTPGSTTMSSLPPSIPEGMRLLLARLNRKGWVKRHASDSHSWEQAPLVFDGASVAINEQGLYQLELASPRLAVLVLFA